MKQFLTVIAFSLLVIGFFTGFSNFGIPRIEPALPPSQEKLDLSEMTMDQFVALGERIYNGKGTCTLCHNDLGRAPMLDEIVANTPKRLADAGYQGEATDVESYLVESFVEPSAYVVAGFGKKGSNDTVSPMPDVSAGSIGLDEAEMAAVIAYLQDAGGAEITVEIPTDMGEAEEEDEEGEAREALTGLGDIIDEFGCGTCHKMGEEEGEVGPDLTVIGAKLDREAMRRAIIDPNAEIAEGFEADTMPDDIGALMYAQELELLLDYLTGLK